MLAAEAEEGVHVSEALEGFFLGEEFEGRFEEGSGDKDDAFSLGAGDGDVESVEAVEEGCFSEGSFGIADTVANKDGFGLLALHFIDGIDKGRAFPGVSLVEGLFDGADLDVVRADDKESRAPEETVASGVFREALLGLGAEDVVTQGNGELCY